MNSSAFSELGRRTKAPPISWLMHAALQRPNLISLAAGFTDNPSLPVREVRELARQILGSNKNARPALQYGSTIGDSKLIEATVQHLRRLDHAPASSRAYSPDRVIITSGSQQLLYMVTEALCNPRDIVLVEDPTYFVYLGIAQSHGLCVRGVRMQTDGIDLAHLETVLESLKRSGELRRLKLLYIVSYFQNPTGITTILEKKHGALQLLKKYERFAEHPIYLIEDAAYRELFFAGLVAPKSGSSKVDDNEKSALAVRGFETRLIYTGTYSKPFATGVRVGFGFLPEPVLSTVRYIKGNHDFGTANLLQQFLARALASGQYDRHLVALRKRYAFKARVMREALIQHFPAAVKWEMPRGGLYFWAQLPRTMKSGPHSKLFQAVLDKDVLYVPGALCYADDPTRRKPDNEMRISFGSASEGNICEGIRRLGIVLKKLVA